VPGMTIDLELEIVLEGRTIRRVRIGPSGLMVGRAFKNDVVLSNSRVSKEHARLSVRDSSVVVTDLGSTCGTLMDGKPIQQAELSAGDEFTIGPFTLKITQARETTPQPTPPDSTVVFRNLVKSLLNLTSIVGITDVQTVLETLLDHCIRLVGAQSGFVVLAQQGTLSPILVRKGDSSDEDETFSRTICQEALEQLKPVILTRSANPSRLESIASLADKHPGLVLALPLIDSERVLGVLYLEGDEYIQTPLLSELEMLREVSMLGCRALWLALERRQIVGEQERWHWLFALETEGPDIFRSGDSPQMREVLDVVRNVSGEDVTVLISGESGTGKDVTARTIHQLSQRRNAPFAALNCGAIPRELMESELFGYERGAFTGATTRKLGRMELAQGGTLLLDEVGELAKDLQVKLLRVLESRSFERVGGQQSIKLDVRLIAATNRVLGDLVAKGEFREDLYYRLNVVEIRVPPLRSRLDDLETLIHEILLACNRRFKRKLYGVSPEALAVLRSYNWPGNVRELKNVIERAFILEKSDRITPDSLPFPARADLFQDKKEKDIPPLNGSHVVGLTDFLVRQEKDYIRLILDHAHGNVTQAARLLQINRTALHRRMRQLGLAKADANDDEDKGT